MTYALAQDIVIGSEDVGVAITHGALGSHLGIAYCDEDGTAKLLHLAWHKRLAVDSYPPSDMRWLVSIMQMPVVASSQAVALVRGMADQYGNERNHDSFDYGINLFAGRDAIKLDGEYSPGPDCDGFTCASIVAEALRRVGFQLVDLTTWVSAPKNEAWGRAIICLLRATGVLEPHVKRVEANINGLRLRPEEIGAAAELSPKRRPAPHAAVQERADQIFAQIQADCGPPPETHTAHQHCVTTYQDELASLAQQDPSGNSSTLQK